MVNFEYNTENKMESANRQNQNKIKKTKELFNFVIPPFINFIIISVA